MKVSSDVSRTAKLWYKQPASKWEEALPVGNGRIGGMVFGNVETEHIQLNEDSVWYGSPRDRNNKDAYSNLNEIRRLIFEERIDEASELAMMALSGTPESQRHYQPLGDLYIDFDNKGDYQDYKRELNLDNGTVRITYSIDDTKYTREIFVSAIEQVMVIRLEADKSSKISFKSYLRREKYIEKIETINNDSIILSAHCGGEKGMMLSAMVSAVSDGGHIYTLGENLVVENADSVTLILSAKTEYRSIDIIEACVDDIKKAESISYNTLLRRHIKDYQNMYNRMDISIEGDGTNIKELDSLPTDERLQRVKDGLDDFGLISLYFQFGRYLMISCSRPGTLPSNLQGVWNKDMNPAWDSKYTININTEMNYWPVEVCNLAECHIPLFDHIEKMRKPGRETARIMYGCSGFVAHHNTDIWGDTAPQDMYSGCSYWPMGAAWLCLHLWEHYSFSKDIQFLRRSYGTMKEAAEFFIDFLIEDKKGNLVTCPSSSPENGYISKKGEKSWLCAGPSMDSQIIYMLFKQCIETSKILDMDYEFRKTLEGMRNRLPKIKIGRYGQIQEWSEDYEEIDPGHRHISHLFALYPGDIINVRYTKKLAEAAKKTLERRLTHGGGHTGWSRAWIINMWARLEEGEEAYTNVMELLKTSTLPNLFDNHPPFQIDGNFGGTAGIAEMLIQSHGGEINLLPALPGKWHNGYIRGVRARGGFTLDIQWHNNRITDVHLKSDCGEICRIRIKNDIRIYSKDNMIKPYTINDGCIEFMTKKGEEYLLTATS